MAFSGTEAAARQVLVAGAIPLSKVDEIRVLAAPAYLYVDFTTKGAENSAGAAATHAVPFQVRNHFGNAVAVAARLEFYPDSTGTATASGAATAVSGDGTASCVLDTDATGGGQVTVGNANDTAITLRCRFLEANTTTHAAPTPGQELVDELVSTKVVTFIP